MRLVWLGVEKIGRFAAKASVDVDGRVVSLVGANESGKTTLLRAWEQLSKQESEEIARLLTQGAEVGEDDEVVSDASHWRPLTARPSITFSTVNKHDGFAFPSTDSAACIFNSNQIWCEIHCPRTAWNVT